MWGTFHISCQLLRRFWDPPTSTAFAPFSLIRSHHYLPHDLCASPIPESSNRPGILKGSPVSYFILFSSFFVEIFTHRFHDSHQHHKVRCLISCEKRKKKLAKSGKELHSCKMTNKNRLYLDEMGYCVGQVLSVDNNTKFFPQESSCIRIDDKKYRTFVQRFSSKVEGCRVCRYEVQ